MNYDHKNYDHKRYWTNRPEWTDVWLCRISTSKYVLHRFLNYRTACAAVASRCAAVAY